MFFSCTYWPFNKSSTNLNSQLPPGHFVVFMPVNQHLKEMRYHYGKDYVIQWRQRRTCLALTLLTAVASHDSHFQFNYKWTRRVTWSDLTMARGPEPQTSRRWELGPPPSSKPPRPREVLAKWQGNVRWVLEKQDSEFQLAVRPTVDIGTVFYPFDPQVS